MNPESWSFYDVATGLFAPGCVTCSSDHVSANTPAGYAAMQGRFDALSQRVDLATGQVVDYQPPAPAATEDVTWVWNADRRRWVARSTLTMNKKARKAPIKEARVALIEQQHDPMRRLLIALATGGTAAAALSNLQSLRDQIKALDDVIDAINACTTQEHLDAIVWP